MKWNTVFQRRCLSRVLCVCMCVLTSAFCWLEQAHEKKKWLLFFLFVCFLLLPLEHQCSEAAAGQWIGRGSGGVGEECRGPGPALLTHPPFQTPTTTSVWRSPSPTFRVSTFAVRSAVAQRERARERILAADWSMGQSVGRWVCLFFRDCQQTLRGEMFNHSPLACCKPQHEDKSN